MILICWHIFSGDPKDQSLRKLERDVLIPKKIREKIKKEKCAKEFGGNIKVYRSFIMHISCK